MNGLTDAARVIGLAWRLALAAKARITLSVLLIAVAMVVFLLVTELSRASTDGLEQAIADESGGARGSYAIDVDTHLAMGWPALTRTVLTALEPMASQPMTYADSTAAMTSECPPYQALGPVPFIIVYNADGTQHDLDFGNDIPADTVVCLAGQRIADWALHMPTPLEQRQWGSGLYVARAYEDAIDLANPEPPQRRFVLTTGVSDGQRQQILDRLQVALADPMARADQTHIDSIVTVTRIDGAESTRAASDGIRIVYTIIAWGVLALAGLGLLVSQLIVTRDRMWFFGLSRTLGARRAHIALLIITDAAITVLAGTLLALLLAAAIQPLAADFARSAFQIEAQLVNPAIVPRLITAALAALLIASTWPAARATRQDPVDVLEPKQA